MSARRLVSGFLTLLTVQYAALAGASPCIGATDTGRADSGAAHHPAPAPTDTAPCDTGAHSGHDHHATHNCLAMAGCAGTAAMATQSAVLDSSAPAYSAAPRAPVRFHSYTAPPDTPPPIA